jgi:hypothetical protein
MNTALGLFYGASGSPYTTTTPLYVGLCTAVGADGAVTGEPTIGVSGYARVSVANTSTNWNTAASGSITNKTAITFPTASGAWGSVTMWFISDSATLTTGHVVVYGQLGTGKSPTTGDTPSFAAYTAPGTGLTISLTATA